MAPVADRSAAVDDDDDCVPEPGLFQCFPVVVPLSDRNLGPREVMTPSDVWSSIRDKESVDEQWMFKRDRAQASLAREQGLVTKLRQRAERHERDADRSASHAASQLADIELAAEERRKKIADSVQQMRMRVKAQQKLRDEAAQAGRERLGEAHVLLDNEQQHTKEVEALLQRRKEYTASVWKNIEELEAQSEARLASVEKEVESSEEESKQRLSDMREKVKAQVAHAEARGQEDLAAARERWIACEKSCTNRLEVEAKRKDESDDTLHKKREMAAARLEVDQFIIKKHLSSVREDCDSHVQRKLDRERTTELNIGAKVENLAGIFESSANRSLQAHERERQSVASMGRAVYTMGEHFVEKAAYNPRTDEMLSSCLQGHLHGMPDIACPSPRALPPPDVCGNRP